MKFSYQPNKLILFTLKKIFTAGKKEKLERVFNKFFCATSAKLSFSDFLKAVELLRSDIDILPVKKRGKIYKIPTGVSQQRGLKIGLKFLKTGIKQRKENSIAKKVFSEINDIIKLRKCHSLALKNDMYQAALFNRAFIHFRWR